LAYFIASLFVREWYLGTLSSSLIDTPWTLYDLRKTSLQDYLLKVNYLSNSNYINRQNGQGMINSNKIIVLLLLVNREICRFFLKFTEQMNGTIPELDDQEVVFHATILHQGTKFDFTYSNILSFGWLEKTIKIYLNF
jgi:hypothetical protein